MARIFSAVRRWAARAAARLVSVGDTVLVFSFAYLTEEEAARHRARIVLMGEDNEVKEIFDQ